MLYIATKKGDFPHAFHNLANYSYKDAYPSKAANSYDEISIKDNHELSNLYSKASAFGEFEFREQMARF